MTLIKVVIFVTIMIFPFRLFTFPSYAAEENACIECHEDFKKPSKSVHAVMKMGCSACHQSVEGKSHPEQKDSIILTQKVPGLCFGCHKESQFKGTSGHTRLGMCTGCHNPHSSNSMKLLLSDQPELCYSCHDKGKFTKKYVHKIINMLGCTSCHEPHVSEHPSLLSSPEYELCVSCHATKVKGSHVVALPGRKRHPVRGVKDPSTLKMITVADPKNPLKQIEVPDPNVPGKNMDCSSCHNPHSSDFRGLLTQARICTKCHKV